MTKDRVAIATMTYDNPKNPEQTDLMRQTLHELSNGNIKVYVADGSPEESFAQELRKMGHNVERVLNKGLSGQHRFSMLAVSEAAYHVLYMEPDKLAFVEHGLEKTIDAHLERKPDLTIASRPEEAMSTFPTNQQITERMASKYIGEITGLETDYIYGPKMFRSITFRGEMEKIQPGHGWEGLMFLVGRAHALDAQMENIDTGQPCPEAQRSEVSADDAAYRAKQGAANLRGFNFGLYGWGNLEHKS
tara:strand:- start:253 stop:993 length:741 start_codon:yes stop_codon:yes gene_type:complete